MKIQGMFRMSIIIEYPLAISSAVRGSVAGKVLVKNQAQKRRDQNQNRHQGHQ